MKDKDLGAYLRVPGENEFSALDPNHSHYFLVEDGVEVGEPVGVVVYSDTHTHTNIFTLSSTLHIEQVPARDWPAQPLRGCAAPPDIPQCVT